MWAPWLAVGCHVFKTFSQQVYCVFCVEDTTLGSWRGKDGLKVTVLGVEDFVIERGEGPCPPLQGLTGAALRAEPRPRPRVWAGRGEVWSPRSSTWGFHGVWVSPLLSLEELGGVLGGEFWHLGQLCLPVCGEAFHYFSSWYSLWGLTCTPTVTPRTQNEARKGGYGFGRGREIEGSDKDHLEGSYEAQGTEGRGTG